MDSNRLCSHCIQLYLPFNAVKDTSDFPISSLIAACFMTGKKPKATGSSRQKKPQKAKHWGNMACFSLQPQSPWPCSRNHGARHVFSSHASSIQRKGNKQEGYFFYCPAHPKAKKGAQRLPFLQRRFNPYCLTASPARGLPCHSPVSVRRKATIRSRSPFGMSMPER